MNLWWKEENWPSLKKDMDRGRNPVVNGVCEADFLELVEDPVPRKTVTNFLQRTDSKPITYENAFPPEKLIIAIAKLGKVC